LYGLRQVGRQLYAKLSTFLLSNNYSIFVVDHSLFLKYNNDKLTLILVYVDDLVLTGDDKKEIKTTTASLHHHFKVKNLGHLTYFLGLEIARNSSGLHLSLRCCRWEALMYQILMKLEVVLLFRFWFS